MNGLGGRVVFFTLAGLLAGLLTWVVSDLSGLIHIGDNVQRLTPAEVRGYWIVFTAWGGFIGVLLGVADTLLSGTLGQWGKVVGVGLLVGILSGVIGGALGMLLFGPLYVFPAKNPLDFIRNVFARGVGWAIIGAMAGTAPGWRKWSVRVGRNGFIGGLIGGLIGGAAFEIVPYLLVGLSSPGIAARLFGFAITGTMIGLFIALVSELFKEAWIRVIVGRNEGKEFLIEKEETRIGRFELSDIPLFGDPSVARTHAVLAAQGGGRFFLRDTGESPAGVLVNGQRIAGESQVRNGDQIQLGGKLLVFYERFTKEATVAAPRDVAPVRPMSSGLPSLSDLPQANSIGSAALRAAEPIMNSSRLVALSGPYAGTTFSLPHGAVIGRDPNVEIPIPNDAKASRAHARVLREGASFVIEDAGSTNGTFVNGQRVTRQSLAPGDTIIIGGTSLRLE